MIDFLPKQDIDAEESLIASILIKNSELDKCLDLAPDDFYKSAHNKIYKAILTLINQSETADLVTIAHYLKNNKQLEEIGGGHFLAKIVETAPISLNVKEHAKIIKDCSTSRKILNTAMMIIDKCRENTPTADLLNFAQSEFLQVENREMSETIHNVKDLINSHIDRIEKNNTLKEGGGYATGFPVIDKRLTVRDGKLILIAGRPGMGKTSLAVTIARNMDKQGVKVGFMSLEMPESEIIDKFLAIESGVDSSKFDRYKGLNQDDYGKLGTSASVLSRSEIVIDSTGNRDFNQVAQCGRKMVKDGVQIIFIDQLSQMKGMNSTEQKDRFARYSANVNRVALLKKELGIPIFLLAQLNRELEKRINKEPRLSDLKNAGDLEEDADAVLLLYRPGMYENLKVLTESEQTQVESKTVINLAKNRKGGTVWTDRVLFHNLSQYFYTKGK